MTTTEMKTAIVRRFGFEHPATLYFFECCEISKGDHFLNEIAFDFAMQWVESGE